MQNQELQNHDILANLSANRDKLEFKQKSRIICYLTEKNFKFKIQKCELHFFFFVTLTGKPLLNSNLSVSRLLVATVNRFL